MRRKPPSERNQLALFRALPGDLAPRDSQDLMAYPFFSLAKSKRIVPIDFHVGGIRIRVEGIPEHGMATIWDADVLIWAASQIVEARDAGLKTSRLMAATPYEILSFVGRGTSVRDYDRLKAALDRLQSTTVLTSIRQPAERRRHRFSWINEWKETADAHGRPLGLELILPDWFYAGVLDDALVLTIDRAYFELTGGLERWLYRVVRKHGGRQAGGWSFDILHLHRKSGSLSPPKHFAYDLREIVRRQTLPGYRLILDRRQRVLSFTPGSIFAFVRWAANDFGTVVSRIDILRAVPAGAPCATVPYVRPGGDILLRIAGWASVRQVLQMIDTVEGLGIDPADSAPDYWRHVHNRLSAGETPRWYTRSRHQAWLRRQRIEP